MVNLAEEVLAGQQSAQIYGPHGTSLCDVSELQLQTLRIASILSEAHLAGQVVLVGLEPETRSLAALLGVIAAGCIAVPVSASLDRWRLERFVAVTGGKAYVQAAIDGKITNRPLSTPEDIPCIDISGQTTSPSFGSYKPMTANDPAVILMTSGTSADPKGVALSHSNLLSNISGVREATPFGPNDTVVLTLPMYYSFGLSMILTALQAGSDIKIMQPLKFPSEFLEELIEAKPTVFAGVPIQYAALVKDSKFSQTSIPSLRMALQAGGVMPVQLTQQFIDRFPRCDLYLMYGQTEATARLTVLNPRRVRNKPWSVGAPIQGTLLTIRDAAGSLTPNGTSGEIYASGPGVMLGYWGDDAGTASALTQYGLKTGDLGLIDEDGDLKIVGRLSDFAKIRSERIALPEIEAAILRLPSIVDCVVQCARDDSSSDDKLRALIKLASPIELADVTKEIYRCLLHHYSAAVRPEVLEVLSIPLTESGKKVRHYSLMD